MIHYRNGVIMAIFSIFSHFYFVQFAQCPLILNIYTQFQYLNLNISVCQQLTIFMATPAHTNLGWGKNPQT